jgi:transcriptional regulator with XRE-family HTH domain
MSDPWTAQPADALGAFIRSQRELAQLSLRQLAEMTKLSHPYLSQVERGMHQPSVRVLKLLSEALNVSATACSAIDDPVGGENGHVAVFLPGQTPRA